MVEHRARKETNDSAQYVAILQIKRRWEEDKSGGDVGSLSEGRGHT